MFYDHEEEIYLRVPKDVVKVTDNPHLYALSRMTSGGRLRFITNSKFIALKASLPAFPPAHHMPITLTHGFSVYADGVFKSRYSAVFKDFLEVKEYNEKTE